MRSLISSVFVSTVLFLGASTLALAEDVPRLNVEPSCRAAASLESFDQKQLDACLQDEEIARKEVVKEWSTFSASARRECYSETNLDGSPSYVEYLECLRLARDSKKYPSE